MNIDTLKIIKACNEYSNQDVTLSTRSKFADIDAMEYSFEWVDEGLYHDIKYVIAAWEVEKFCKDTTLDEVLIGKFKFEYERRFGEEVI